MRMAGAAAGAMRPARRGWRRLAPACALALGAAPALAFVISGTKWVGAAAEIHVSIDGTAASGIRWNAAVAEAMAEWSAATPFEFRLVEEYRSPCGEDGYNGVDFVDDLCGAGFGAGTLAITTRRFAPTVLGEPYTAEADIAFNSAIAFDIYSGPLNPSGGSRQGLDFRRVALHELGHVIGLDHEPTAVSIMRARIGDIDRLQPDDVEAVETLHGGLSRCGIVPLAFGAADGILNGDDCTVSELTVGGADHSFIDLYRFSLAGPARLEFASSSSRLDTVLVLADEELRFLQAEVGEEDSCDAELAAELDAGDYFLMVNTWSRRVIEKCGVAGSYRLVSSLASDSLLPLGEGTSLLGGASAARFSGGVTADGGLSFGNRFRPDESLDISMEVAVDPRHRGEPGFVVVAALLDGGVLMLDGDGRFAPAPPGSFALTPAATGPLDAVEEIAVASGLVPAAFGIDEAEVNFVIGYGLDADPDEIYYHRSPLNLSVGR